MLDVHILIHPSTPDEWIARCVDSVREAKERAGFEVDIHKLGVRGPHIGHDRARGYALGSHPYVTSVDDDDWLEPDAFAVLADAMAQHPVAVTTRCMAHQNGRAWVLPWRTNLRVFRRDVAASAPLADWPVYDGPAMLAHADTCGEVMEVKRPVYHYRLHSSNHRALMRAVAPDVAARIQALPAGVHLSRAA